MKLKQLEGLLGRLDQFPNPKMQLEQYPMGPHIASPMIFMVRTLLSKDSKVGFFCITQCSSENSFEDISNKVVADFGCGCGTLGVAAALLSAEHVLSIYIDPESLEIASLNAEELEPQNESGYSMVELGTPDMLLRCSAKEKLENQNCFFKLTNNVMYEGDVLCRIPSGKKAHSDLVFAITFSSALLSTLVIVPHH
ncbi:hypothetical protein PIB30_039324 [Stylosanthes scabra]|uniref:Methyltransferase small domain-containing protein n=1 Tax=Stylosanthes scabra TaxID=79078 RepID=A0ABU6REF5_9FABA|nr:hypothetical protein [Stylosanthes scabra]